MPASRFVGQASARAPMKVKATARGDALGRAILDGAVEVHRADAEIAAAGGEHFPDELVVRLVLRDGSPDPVVISLRGVGPEIDGELRLDAQNVTPFHRPVIGELVPLQQAVNQDAALVLRVRCPQ